MESNLDIEERIKITRDIIWQVNTHQDYLEYLSSELKNEQFSAQKNEGVFFLWRSTMAMQILGLSKLINDHGPFSLTKIFNIIASKNKNFDKATLTIELNEIAEHYKLHRFHVVRNKYIGHLDNYEEEIKTDIHSLAVSVNQVTGFFDRLSSILGKASYEHDDRCIQDLKKIFSEIDDYEKVKSVIVSNQIKGKSQVDISEFNKAIKC
jgi:hypothetical protein